MASPLNCNIKEKILQTAALLLESKPFADITLAEISHSAKISKGTLYYYYKNKEDILFDVADIYLTKLADDLINWTSDKQKDTSLPRLYNYTFSRGVFNESGGLRLYLISAAVVGQERVRERLLEKYVFFQNTLSEKIAQRSDIADADYCAWLILTVMDGILVQSCLANSQFNPQEFIKKTVNLLQK